MKIRMAASLLALTVLLAACGGGGHEDHGLGGSDGGTSSFGEPGDAADADRTIEVEATEDLKFDPAALDVAQGETITFEVTNDASIEHEFVLGDAAYQDSHGEDMAEGMDHSENGVTLEPGATEQITWTFSEAGEVLYACHVAGHYDAGMKGTVTVE